MDAEGGHDFTPLTLSFRRYSGEFSLIMVILVRSSLYFISQGIQSYVAIDPEIQPGKNSYSIQIRGSSCEHFTNT